MMKNPLFPFRINPQIFQKKSIDEDFLIITHDKKTY